MKELSPKVKETIWNILAEQAGAYEDDYPSFMRQWPKCGEFRFQGHLGFGGKIYYQDYADIGKRIYVSCYREDETKRRLEIIEDVNKRIANVLREAK